MPGKNIIKQYAANQYYHVYSRGVAKQVVFKDAQDFATFLGLLKRYLSLEPAQQPSHGYYPHFGSRLKLLAYCLMPNHVHMLIYQYDQTAMTELMRCLMTSYGMYFNRKYKRVGPVFQSNYRASLIDRDNYLDHISRYIHLNPQEWAAYPYSSLKYYTGEARAEWLTPNMILEMFPTKEQYLEFLKDYEDYKETLDDLQWGLANS